MDIDFCVKVYIQNYNLLIEQLSLLFTEETYKDYLVLLNSESKDKKWVRGVRFHQQMTQEYFDIFVDSKIKLFSHKDDETKKLSETLFGEELSLKKIFNNRDDNNKNVLWHYLHLMYLMVESAQKKQNKEKIKKLTKLIETNEDQFKKSQAKLSQQSTTKNMKDPKTMIREMFNVDVNTETNEMLTDIVKSFESTLSGGIGSNPFSGLMDISQKISTKYKDKINNGEIELNKLMEGIQKNVPGMEVIMKGGGLGNMGNLSGLMGKMGGMAGLGGLGSMGSQKPKETVVIDENFSTSNVELGELPVGKDGFNIGNMLKLADSFGVIPELPGAKEKEENANQTNQSNQGLKGMDPALSELFGMITNMGSMNKKEDLESLKSKMDDFLVKQGVDIKQLNGQIDSLMEKNKEQLENKKSDDLD
jgi:hypothetical protein